MICLVKVLFNTSGLKNKPCVLLLNWLYFIKNLSLVDFNYNLIFSY